MTRAAAVRLQIFPRESLDAPAYLPRPRAFLPFHRPAACNYFITRRFRISMETMTHLVYVSVPEPALCADDHRSLSSFVSRSSTYALLNMDTYSSQHRRKCCVLASPFPIYRHAIILFFFVL